jgi:vacuolar-type H+-ATPase subunit E/Vma4
MKKVILTLALAATLLVISCKEATEDKVETAVEAVGEEIETTTDNAVEAIDDRATEVGEDIEAGVEKMDAKIKETVK